MFSVHVVLFRITGTGELGQLQVSLLLASTQAADFPHVEEHSRLSTNQCLGIRHTFLPENIFLSLTDNLGRLLVAPIPSCCSFQKTTSPVPCSFLKRLSYQSKKLTGSACTSLECLNKPQSIAYKVFAGYLVPSVLLASRMKRCKELHMTAGGYSLSSKSTGQAFSLFPLSVFLCLAQAV